MAQFNIHRIISNNSEIKESVIPFDIIFMLMGSTIDLSKLFQFDKIPEQLMYLQIFETD